MVIWHYIEWRLGWAECTEAQHNVHCWVELESESYQQEMNGQSLNLRIDTAYHDI